METTTTTQKALDWKDTLIILLLLAFTSYGTFKLARGVDTIKRVPLMFRSGSEQAEPVFRLAVKALK